MKFRLRRQQITIMALVFAVLVGFYFFVIAPKQKQKPEKATVKRVDLEETLIISGEIAADEDAKLSFQTAGRLAWVGVKEGDYVKKYQSIASLDQRQLKKTLQKNLNTYIKERHEFEQTKDDNPALGTSDQIAERLRAVVQGQQDLNNSVIDVELQTITVELANLWTPIEGIVTRVDKPYAGQNVSLTDVYEVVNPQTVYFSASADQTEVIDLAKSMQGNLVLDSYPDQKIKGYIKDISFTPVEEETGTVYQIRFNFDEDNSNYRYRLRMTGDLTFVTEKKSGVLSLPIKFVKSEKGKKYVTVMENRKQTKKYVTTGLETDDLVEIRSGLKEDNVVYD